MKLKTDVKAGGFNLNHNETMVGDGVLVANSPGELSEDDLAQVSGGALPILSWVGIGGLIAIAQKEGVFDSVVEIKDGEIKLSVPK
jgi:bacteriocin-like protein